MTQICTAGDFSIGYDENILGVVRVPFPAFYDKAKKDALLDEYGLVKIVHHTHYSLAMNRLRKLAIVVANGIDGATWQQIDRKAEWAPDPEIDLRYQILGDFYEGNVWDLGHLGRRADLCYGTREEAERASKESFLYSNAAPQHSWFNGDEWNALENWVLRMAKTHKMPVSVFTGPVFGDWDIPEPNYKKTGIKIPQSYFKIKTAIHPRTQRPVSLAFLMNQSEMWADRDGHQFLELCLYQVMVRRIEWLTGLDFGECKDWDPLGKDCGCGKPGLLSVGYASPVMRIHDVHKIVM